MVLNVILYINVVRLVQDFRTNELIKSIFSQAHYRGTTYLPGLLTGIYIYRNRNYRLSKVKAERINVSCVY